VEVDVVTVVVSTSVPVAVIVSAKKVVTVEMTVAGRVDVA
jgi:hypothetical protein